MIKKIGATIFLGALCVVGYGSVGITVYLIATGKAVMPSCRGDGELNIVDPGISLDAC